MWGVLSEDDFHISVCDYIRILKTELVFLIWILKLPAYSTYTNKSNVHEAFLKNYKKSQMLVFLLNYPLNDLSNCITSPEKQTMLPAILANKQ